VRYDRVPAGYRPEDLVAALSEYVDFGPLAPPTLRHTRAPEPEPLLPAGDVTQLRKGMTRAEAVRTFGRPADVSERKDGGLAVTTLVFIAGDQRISAEFVEDVCVRYTISSK
jgi:hypothetical protein